MWSTYSNCFTFERYTSGDISSISHKSRPSIPSLSPTVVNYTLEPCLLGRDATRTERATGLRHVFTLERADDHVPGSGGVTDLLNGDLVFGPRQPRAERLALSLGNIRRKACELRHLWPLASSQQLQPRLSARLAA